MCLHLNGAMRARNDGMRCKKVSCCPVGVGARPQGRRAVPPASFWRRARAHRRLAVASDGRCPIPRGHGLSLVLALSLASFQYLSIPRSCGWAGTGGEAAASTAVVCVVATHLVPQHEICGSLIQRWCR
jgi:hypothetical protein